MKLASHIIPTSDLDGAKSFYATLTGSEPAIDTPYYVQFETESGVALGLDPNAVGKGVTMAVPYFAVDDVDAKFRSLIDAGATEVQAPADVGGGARTAVVTDAGGHAIGMINS